MLHHKEPYSSQSHIFASLIEDSIITETCRCSSGSPLFSPLFFAYNIPLRYHSGVLGCQHNNIGQRSSMFCVLCIRVVLTPSAPATQDNGRTTPEGSELLSPLASLSNIIEMRMTDYIHTYIFISIICRVYTYIS